MPGTIVGSGNGFVHKTDKDPALTKKIKISWFSAVCGSVRYHHGCFWLWDWGRPLSVSRSQSWEYRGKSRPRRGTRRSPKNASMAVAWQAGEGLDAVKSEPQQGLHAIELCELLQDASL